MPVLVRDFTWQQSADTVLISLPMKVYRTSGLDVVATSNYVKVHYPPLLFELFPWDPVDEAQCRCTVTDDDVQLTLRKFENKTWEKLEADYNKAEKLEVKKQALEELAAKEQQSTKQRLDRNAELKRVAVRSQMAVDTERRKMIAKLKEDDKQTALKEIGFWRSMNTNEGHKITEYNPIVENRGQRNDSGGPSAQPEAVNCEFSAIEAKKKTRSAKRTTKKPTIDKCELDGLVDAPKIAASVPLPRRNATINISFTPRAFPTPKRESKSKEEQEWLAKQAEARRTVGFMSEDLRPEERNPECLREKGDAFFKHRNYYGAISAYSFGIGLSGGHAPLYVNRSAAHMALGNYHKALEDCSTALDLMKPAVPSNLKARAKCLARRGAALCKLGLLQQGADEMEAAVKLLPQDEHLAEDLEAIKLKLANEL